MNVNTDRLLALVVIQTFVWLCMTVEQKGSKILMVLLAHSHEITINGDIKVF